MFRTFDQRSHTQERLDKGEYTAEEYALWQKEMKLINRWLGDTRALRLSLVRKAASGQGDLSILDVGAGSGELLLSAKAMMGSGGRLFVGAELNTEAAASIARRPGLTAVQCNALKLPFADNSFDVVISSLFLHHLDDGSAVTLITEMARVARRKFFVIDLHRHAAAYHLYKSFGPLFLQPFTVEDGSLSILRSFRPRELYDLALRAG
ncbi:MAG: methyltransferase domain-containing protein, partial [Pyrinomonadaceae bacterium]